MLANMSPSRDVFDHETKDMGDGSVTLAFHASVLAKQKSTEAEFPEKDTNFSERTKKLISFLKSRETTRDSVGESLIYNYRLAIDDDDDDATQPISNCSKDRSGRFTKSQEVDPSPSTPEDSPSRIVRFEVNDAKNWKKGVKEHIMGPPLRPASDMTPREKQDIWWEHSELVQFRKKTTLASNDLNRSSEVLPGSYSATLKKAYHACCSADAKDNADDDNEDILNSREKLELVSWTRASPSRRGLEYKAMSFLTEEVKRNREGNQSVIELQQKLDDAHIRDSKLRCDALRVFSEKRSKTAKFFARIMAQADAEAIVEIPSNAPTGSNAAFGTTTRRYTI